MRIEQAGDEIAPAQVHDHRALGQWHTLIVEQHFGNAMVANHYAGIGNAAAETVEDCGATQHQDLSLGGASLDGARAGQLAHAEGGRGHGRRAEHDHERRGDDSERPSRDRFGALPPEEHRCEHDTHHANAKQHGQ